MLKHHFDHLFSTLFWVSDNLSQYDTDRFFWCLTEFVVKSVLPDLFHVMPTLNFTFTDRSEIIIPHKMMAYFTDDLRSITK